MLAQDAHRLLGELSGVDLPPEEPEVEGKEPDRLHQREPLAAANLGDDADTTAAVYGQLAGYGEAGIPAEWTSKLALLGTIEELADRLHDAARG